MSSIKDRIAAFSTGGSSKSPNKDKVDEKPSGYIIHTGWLGKAGAGILSSTYSKRYCVLHIDAAGVPMLSMYEAMDMEKLKGARMALTDASISQADDKLQIAITVDGKPVTAKFKATNAALTPI